MREAQEESRHLWQFAREVGLEIQAGGRVWVTDLWQQLQDWYVESGILEIEDSAEKTKPKLIWNELSNKYDTPVKAVNQLYARLCEIFPKVQIHRYNGRDEMERRGQKFLLGISLLESSTATDKTGLPELPVDTASVTALPSELPKNTGNPLGNSQTLTQRGGNPGNPISSPFAEVCNLLSQLTDSERQELAKMLAPTDTVKVEKGLRVRYIGAKHAEQLAGLDLVVYEINLYREITCTKPDGGFTTWLSARDLTAT
jgi:putative DNA primase/helicase